MLPSRSSTATPLVCARELLLRADRRPDAGCNGGNPPTAYEYVIKAGGMELETSYPYVAKDTKCTAEPSKFVAKISGYKWATKTKNETEMQAAVYSVV